MKLNWKVRLKNKIWVGSFLAFIVTTVFTVLGMFDVYPNITEDRVLAIVNQAVNLLSMLGILVDPTTEGFGDSQRALGYEEPWKDSEEE